MNTKWNINNVSVNIYLSPLFIVLQYFVIKNLNNTLDQAQLFTNILISLAVYIYSSMFFQPDLDIHPNKPGKATFPLGPYLFNIASGLTASVFLTNIKRGKKILYSILYPINRIWYYFWAPYGILLTHRGISHWPIVGVLTRIYYIKIFLFFINIPITNTIDSWLDNFFFWQLDDYNVFVVYCLPIYLSDFFHTLIDFMESKLKGFDFCPPLIDRGVAQRLINAILMRKEISKKKPL